MANRVLEQYHFQVVGGQAQNDAQTKTRQFLPKIEHEKQRIKVLHVFLKEFQFERDQKPPCAT